VFGSTLLLTTSFIGVVAFITGFVSNFENRLPVYILITAVVFVVVVVALDDQELPGTQVLLSTASIGVLSFVLAMLSGEGLLYAVTNPGRLLSSQLVFYFVAAGLFCTGIGYWGFHHWREFTGQDSTGL
jgi:hypothetical protein